MSKVIYLDDSDFSNIASFPERSDISTLLELLDSGKRDGGLIIPFSYVHLATLLPKSPSNAEQS